MPFAGIEPAQGIALYPNVIKLSTSAHKLLPPSQREGDREAVVGVCGCTVKRG